MTESIRVVRLIRERIIGFSRGIIAEWEFEVELSTGEIIMLYRSGRPTHGTYIFGAWRWDCAYLLLPAGTYGAGEWQDCEFPHQDLGYSLPDRPGSHEQ